MTMKILHFFANIFASDSIFLLYSSFFHSLPLQQPLAQVFQLDSKSYYLSCLVCLERLKVLVVLYLLLCSGDATVLGEFQLYHIGIMWSDAENIDSASREHVLYLCAEPYGIEDAADDEAITLLHIHACQLLVAVRYVGNQCLEGFHGIRQLASI